MDLQRQKVLNDHKRNLAKHGRDMTNAGRMSSLLGPPTPILGGTPQEVTSMVWWQHAAIKIIDALLIGYSCGTTPANIAISAEEACIACETGIPLPRIKDNIIAHVCGDPTTNDTKEDTRGKSLTDEPSCQRFARTLAPAAWNSSGRSRTR